MIDLVYTLKRDPRSGNRQLIYSLRSVEKYLKNIRNVYVIGAAPKLKNVIHVPFGDLHSAAKNIFLKLMEASKTNDLSPDFMYMADDHYILSETDAVTYPYYSNGKLEELIRVQRNVYKNFIRVTKDALLSKGKTTVNFNVHCPIVYNKEKFLALAGEYSMKEPLGYLSKSLYCNHYGMESGNEMKDCKIRSRETLAEFDRKVEGRHVFSTGMESLVSEIMQKLESLYPNKSSFE